MNLRQKSKRYKQLYESLLYSKPCNNVHIIHEQLNHYKANIRMDKEEMYFNNTDYIEEYYKDELISKVMPILKNKIIVEDDNFLNSYSYSIDFWMRE